MPLPFRFPQSYSKYCKCRAGYFSVSNQFYPYHSYTPGLEACVLLSGSLKIVHSQSSLPVVCLGQPMQSTSRRREVRKRKEAIIFFFFSGSSCLGILALMGSGSDGSHTRQLLASAVAAQL